MSNNEERNDDIDIELEDEIVEEEGRTDKMKDMRERLKACEQESKTNLDGWQRARADYANLQKSFEEEKTAIRRRAVEDLILDIVPTLDNFDMAMRNEKVWETVDQQWRTGIEYIYNQLKDSLRERGVEPIDDPSVDFDPEQHEPLETEDTDDEEKVGTIIEIMQKGYRYNGRVIRPAKVKIYRASN